MAFSGMGGTPLDGEGTHGPTAQARKKDINHA